MVNAAEERPGPGSRSHSGRPGGPPSRPNTFGNADRPPKSASFKRKGSRRGLRGRKRSL